MSLHTQKPQTKKREFPLELSPLQKLSLSNEIILSLMRVKFQTLSNYFHPNDTSPQNLQNIHQKHLLHFHSRLMSFSQ